MTDRIVYLNSELYYDKQGAGSKTILLFHGFGQDHRAFETWSEAWKNEATTYRFDLYFHGKSSWLNHQLLQKEDWKRILQLFFDQEKIECFEIVGFSIGARFVFTTLELFPQRIKKIILLAPDGIHHHFWYHLATGTSLMRSLFRSMILKPMPLQSLIKFLKFFHLEDKNRLRWVEFQLSTEEKRQRLYHAWIYFRLLKIDLSQMCRLVNSRNIPVIFILGKFDTVIGAEKIRRVASTLKNHQFHLLHATHQGLIAEGINYIRSRR